MSACKHLLNYSRSVTETLFTRAKCDETGYKKVSTTSY